MSTEPMSDERLAELEANGDVYSNPEGQELIAEVRRARLTIATRDAELAQVELEKRDAQQSVDRLAETVARVRELAAPDYPPPPPDERGAAGWRFAMEHVRATLDGGA